MRAGSRRDCQLHYFRRLRSRGPLIPRRAPGAWLLACLLAEEVVRSSCSAARAASPHGAAFSVPRSGPPDQWAFGPRSLLRFSSSSTAMAEAPALRAEQDSGPTTSAEDQSAAAEMREAGTASTAKVSASALDKLPTVVIDDGTFKYVLLKVSAVGGDSKYLVRGTEGAPYHKDVAMPWVAAYLKEGFEVEILGGGRISHDPAAKSLRIYGFSYGFPWVEGAGHSISSEVCKEFFPPDYKIEWSNEGY